MDFLVQVLKTWLAEKDANSVWSTLKKSGVDNRIMTFLPANKQTFDHLKQVFEPAGLGTILEMQKAGQSSSIRKKLQGEIQSLLQKGVSNKEIVTAVKESMVKNGMAEHEVAVIIWNTVMSANEWNKKEDMIGDQAIKYLRQFVGVFSTFATSPKSALVLMNRIQEYCYENMNFLKVFSKIILLFYKGKLDWMRCLFCLCHFFLFFYYFFLQLFSRRFGWRHYLQMVSWSAFSQRKKRFLGTNEEIHRMARKCGRRIGWRIKLVAKSHTSLSITFCEMWFKTFFTLPSFTSCYPSFSLFLGYSDSSNLRLLMFLFVLHSHFFEKLILFYLPFSSFKSRNKMEYILESHI